MKLSTMRDIVLFFLAHLNRKMRKRKYYCRYVTRVYKIGRHIRPYIFRRQTNGQTTIGRNATV